MFGRERRQIGELVVEGAASVARSDVAEIDADHLLELAVRQLVLGATGFSMKPPAEARHPRSHHQVDGAAHLAAAHVKLPVWQT
jgi:hypothetical protein